ncbi:MAG: S-ribosylhomocysteine lyase [Corallococcus sp.]|nr:S-ribosylhomocysteine lyase [Corallococcus sp.]MCM1359992.1 S-ribosylhomocysteine lyase [Corallococcus sp.]MCM1395549.1 S-ribosylhomocysteine lyase [Corallococcus sp.]
MEKIQSFKVNHLNLYSGLYVSRKDECDGVVVTTFDLRFVAPNREPVMEIAAIHTLEHIGATFLRNSGRAKQVVYFGPMGCRTGFYLVMFGNLESGDVFDLILEMCDCVVNHDGDIPGATPQECGNYADQNLDLAKKYAAAYKLQLQRYGRVIYPE